MIFSTNRFSLWGLSKFTDCGSMAKYTGLRAGGDKKVMMVESCEKPYKQGTARPRQPAQNPAYCGHTAWVMAIMSELAYVRFEVEELSALHALWAELGKAVGRIPLDCELQETEELLATRDNRNNQLRRAMLASGGFELVGALSDPGTDTQGFVAVRRASDEMDMAVVSFRGTENEQDWKTNLHCSLTPADSSEAEGRESTGKVHQGFLDALRSVRSQVDRYLPCGAGLPIFITGHSLGGALATLGAAHLSGWGLVACYTFGAPGVGDRRFSGSLRIPVYRVVNPLDPVPLVPGRWRGYRDLGDRERLRGHVGWTRCGKSAAACFACAGPSGAGFLRRTGSTTKSTNGTMSAYTGRSCAMTLAVWSDTGPSARVWWRPTGDASGLRATSRA